MVFRWVRFPPRVQQLIVKFMPIVDIEPVLPGKGNRKKVFSNKTEGVLPAVNDVEVSTQPEAISSIRETKDKFGAWIDQVHSDYRGKVADPANNVLQQGSQIIDEAIGLATDNEIFHNWLGGTQLGESIGAIRSGITSGINEVKSMLSDPRHLVFKLLQDSHAKSIAPDRYESVRRGRRSASTEDYWKEVDKQYKGERCLAYRDYTDVAVDAAITSTITKSQSSIDGKQFNGDDLASEISFKGYKSLDGITLGSNHLWDLKLFVPNQDFFDGNVEDSYGNGYDVYLPKNTFLPSLSPFGIFDGNRQVLSYQDYQPIIEYEMGEYESSYETIPMYNDSQINIFTGLKFENRISITFLEDDQLSWHRYFDIVVRRIYSRQWNAVAPYKQAVFVARLLIYNSIRDVYFRKEFLVHPISIVKKLDGASDPNALDFTVEFAVVGDLNINQSVQ